MHIFIDCYSKGNVVNETFMSMVNDHIHIHEGSHLCSFTPMNLINHIHEGSHLHSLTTFMNELMISIISITHHYNE